VGVTINNVADEPTTDACALPYRHIDRCFCTPLSCFVLCRTNADIATGAAWGVHRLGSAVIVRQALSARLFKTAQVTIDRLRGPARLAAQWAEEERKASETERNVSRK
jgi:coenzyme F420-reducing hydrogenase beta subunit